MSRKAEMQHAGDGIADEDEDGADHDSRCAPTVKTSPLHQPRRARPYASNMSHGDGVTERAPAERRAGRADMGQNNGIDAKPDDAERGRPPRARQAEADRPRPGLQDSGGISSASSQGSAPRPSRWRLVASVVASKPYQGSDDSSRRARPPPAESHAQVARGAVRLLCSIPLSCAFFISFVQRDEQAVALGRGAVFLEVVVDQLELGRVGRFRRDRGRLVRGHLVGCRSWPRSPARPASGPIRRTASPRRDGAPP